MIIVGRWLGYSGIAVEAIHTICDGNQAEAGLQLFYHLISCQAYECLTRLGWVSSIDFHGRVFWEYTFHNLYIGWWQCQNHRRQPATGSCLTGSWVKHSSKLSPHNNSPPLSSQPVVLRSDRLAGEVSPGLLGKPVLWLGSSVAVPAWPP